MLFDTHQYRVNGDIIPSQLKEIDDHLELYDRMAKMPQEGIWRLEEKDYNGFGQILDEAWQLKRKVGPRVSTPDIDRIYTLAIQAGAIGGKLLGAGGGGFILFLAEPDKQEGIKRALLDLTYVPFKFEQEGTQVIYNDNY